MPFQIVRNDITKMHVDAIVNTANPMPGYGAGIDTAVYEAAGKKELLEKRREIGVIDRGQSVITDGYKLPAKYIIHTVGTAWQGGSSGEEEIIRNCYRSVFRVATDHGIESLAIPLLASGSYGFPKGIALRIALSEIEAFLSDHDLELYLVVFDEKSFSLSAELYGDIDAYINDNYVEEKKLEEYHVTYRPADERSSMAARSSVEAVRIPDFFRADQAKQQKKEGEALVSTVLFDDVTDVVHDRVPIGDVKMLTEDDYFVRGCTALLDAIGGAIHHIGNVHKYAREEDRPAKTLFVITTDGLENASRHYSFHDVKKMIERQREKYHWEFLFLGANIDAIEVAGLMGINRDRAANYLCDDEGTELNYKVLEAAVTRVRKSEVSDIAMAFAGGAWKEEIDRDYEKRGKKNGRRAK